MTHKKGPKTAQLDRRFGHNLLEFRRRIGLSQVAIAERAGLHRTEVALIEAGERLPRASRPALYFKHLIASVAIDVQRSAI